MFSMPDDHPELFHYLSHWHEHAVSCCAVLLSWCLASLVGQRNWTYKIRDLNGFLLHTLLQQACSEMLHTEQC